jgi:hypothetical protein
MWTRPIFCRICETYYADDPNVTCHDIHRLEIEEPVQMHSAEWSLYNAIAYLTPAIFADTILGKVLKMTQILLEIIHATTQVLTAIFRLIKPECGTLL